jgi:hypothetical protein
MAKTWTDKEDQKLKEIYPHLLNAEVAKSLGRSIKAVENRAFLFKLKKTKDFMSQVAKSNPRFMEGGKKSRFQKGHKTWTKGVKGEEFKKRIGEKSFQSMAKTQFKPGTQPPNFEPIGTIKIRKDKRGVPYKFIKSDKPGNWPHLHREVWEQTNGPIPKGSIIAFIDGNTLNCELSNLVCLTKAENMLRNSKNNFPEEIKQIITIKQRITRKLNQLNK